MTAHGSLSPPALPHPSWNFVKLPSEPPYPWGGDNRPRGWGLPNQIHSPYVAREAESRGIPRRGGILVDTATP